MNLGTAVVLVILAVIVAFIVRGWVRDFKAGKPISCGSCSRSGSGCTSCGMAENMAAAVESRLPKE